MTEKKRVVTLTFKDEEVDMDEVYRLMGQFGFWFSWLWIFIFVVNGYDWEFLLGIPAVIFITGILGYLTCTKEVTTKQEVEVEGI